MTDDVEVAVAGIAGYGAQYVNQLLDAKRPGFVFSAAIARRPERSARLAEIQARGTAIYPNLEEFFARSSADLLIVNSPIPLHRAHTCLALAKGASVLCEKPVAATVQDGLAMAEAARRAKGFAAVGYQWSFTRAIQDLKRDILAGAFGRPLRMKTLVFWYRNKAYYARNDWAGRKAVDGEWVLDSPLMNATAHFLHNIFYVLGPTRERAATPVDIQAELYRANAIENFDTAAVRCHTADGVEIVFYTSHAAPSHIGPVIVYEFEKAVVYFEESRHGRLLARFRDGRIKDYGSPNADNWEKIWQCIESVRTGAPVACDVETSIPLTLAVNGAQDSMPEVTEFPKDMIEESPDAASRLVWVKRIQQSFIQCFYQGLLPSEHGALTWARPGKVVDLRSYRHFPGGQSA